MRTHSGYNTIYHFHLVVLRGKRPPGVGNWFSEPRNIETFHDFSLAHCPTRSPTANADTQNAARNEAASSDLL